ncbi:hypothetical protein MMC07_000830 [Pseudocyphellaria aurata]|nr:hypothetical protein [Pseudocyphellaria aurata]
MHYAVVCDAYQLHGQEGQLAGLEHKKGKRVDRSVAAEPRMGDAQNHGATFHSMSKAGRARPAATPKTNTEGGKTPPPAMMTDERRRNPVPRARDRSGPGGLRAFGQRAEDQIGDLLKYEKSVADANVKAGVRPNVAARVYNKGKRAWAEMREEARVDVRRELDKR